MLRGVRPSTGYNKGKLTLEQNMRKVLVTGVLSKESLPATC